ncbi:MAG: DUF4139 domain-containing protein [Lentisphaerae bacterium]|nr:DUF4139 domain-containing protein [Lentisphaerota bacterium]
MNRFLKQLAMVVLVGSGAAGMALAKVDLVTLPTRDTVQLTIYNSADLTLVRESRALTLREGANRLQFSWANTLIDPTSLDLLPKAQADKLDIADLTFPPRVQNLGLWNIVSRASGKVPVEISYLTSGLSWRAFYLGTLSPDERSMRLEGFVRVMNNSGEDYENAQTRLIVGNVHMLDDIATLARRPYPYGSPVGAYGAEEKDLSYPASAPAPMMMAKAAMMEGASADFAMAPKEIVKEGLSEYFLYSIEGTETIPNGWSKRLPSFAADEVPVVNLYKYEEERYGDSVMRFLSFKNDETHKLGQTPIPGGVLKVFRATDAEGRLSYAGQSEFKYIPVEEDVELVLGRVANIIVEPKMMNTKTQNYSFDHDGNIDGWEEVQDWKLEVKNTRDLPVKVELTRNFPGLKWDLKPGGDYGEYEKVDVDSVKFTLAMDARKNQTLTYQLTTRYGRRAD